MCTLRFWDRPRWNLVCDPRSAAEPSFNIVNRVQVGLLGPYRRFPKTCNKTFFFIDELCNTYKLSLLTWKALHTAELSHLSELISPYTPTCTLHSVNTGLLVLPTSVTSHFASCFFSLSSPSVWNSLPANVRSIDNLSTFKCHLKSHLFQSAFAA